MAADLPTAAAIQSGTVTNAQQKSNLGAIATFLLGYLGAKFGIGPQTVASAATLDLEAVTDTRDLVISGTAAVTAVTIEAGKVFRCRASGAFTLTNNANIVTNTGANIICAAGDSFTLRATASNTVEVIMFARAATGRRVGQVITTTTGTVATGTTVMPLDNTIPQITEGDQYMSLAVTPANAGSTLEIDVVLFGSHTAAGYLTAALFQDATANALSVGCFYSAFAGGLFGISFKFLVSASNTTARTYRVRAGCNAAGTFTFNGSAGVQSFGGVLASSITVKEYLP